MRIGASTASVTAQAGTSSSAEGSVRALAVSLLGGEITAESISIRAGAAAGVAGATGDVGSSQITGLVVLGQPVAATANFQMSLADWGTLEALGETSSTSSTAPRSATSSVTGLRVRLIAEHGGLPAGSELVVGVATANAVAVPAPTTPAHPDTDRADQGRRRARTRASPAVRRSLPRLRRVPRPPRRASPATRSPERRRSSYSRRPRSRRGSARAATSSRSSGRPPSATRSARYRGDVAGKWHHGEDLVAPAGTPVLAVADGTLFSVGWNDIGGWRLWLRDTAGNEFYYAHLSAYSPLAVAGKTVKAGDVLGFVGTSGDADGGVPHLHFEIHPVDLVHLGYDGVVAPYPFLVAWRRADDVSFGVRSPLRPGGRGDAGRARARGRGASAGQATSRPAAASCRGR